MKQELILSIIVPHKDNLNGLDRLLKSIPEINDLEIIIVDDKSIDQASVEKISLKHRCAKLFKNNSNESNAGVARNIGISYSKGKWLLFADSDDYFISDKFDCLLGTIEGNEIKEIVFFPPINDGDMVGRDRTSGYRKMIDLYLSDGCEDGLRYCWSPPWSKLILKKIIDDNCIRFSSQKYGNDVLFSVKCGASAKYIKVSKCPIYAVTVRHGSLTSEMSPEKAIDRLNALIDRNHLLKKMQKQCLMQNGLTLFYSSFSWKKPFSAYHVKYIYQLMDVICQKLFCKNKVTPGLKNALKSFS
ncbi:MAG: glycosyltransferase family 2 protein [Chlorobium sp.]|uniref:glycosyltransferase family 2 protein n=1 Tax=Chlorobium sp. TaxID=1095 RepID=UPI002F3FB315